MPAPTRAPAPAYPDAPVRRRPVPRAAVLVVVLLAAFAINLDGTIVNVALPSLAAQLHASTRDLQWIVDGYNLAFAALVLAGGALGDRLGRRPTLATGLVVFGVTAAVAPLAGGPGVLVLARVVMGVAAALIFPTTLSVITATFPERRERAAAIGAWGAVTGLGVAVGPVVGGELLDHYSWGSVFLALVPMAALALVGTLVAVPGGRPAPTERFDVRGLLLSVTTLGLLTGTVIEAPRHGWGSAATLTGFAAAAVSAALLVRTERRSAAPMLDVRLFANLRFSAASGAVTVAFFALFGFIFLIVQYMQVLRGWSPLSAGVRTLPVAGSIAIASAVGTQLAVRLGTKAVVSTGLGLLVAAYGWIADTGGHAPYGQIAVQMVLMGTGLGLTTAPATESIMGAVRPEQAGVGSAVNDATREVGGTLGVAVVGSVFASLYGHALRGLPGLPRALHDTAASSYGAGAAVAHRLLANPSTASLGALVQHRVTTGFLAGLHAGCGVAAGVCAAGALAVLAWLPSRPGSAADPDRAEAAPAAPAWQPA